MTLCLVHCGPRQLSDGQLGGQTKARCEKALLLYRRNKISKLFITGAPKKSGVFMADEMKEYFIKHKVQTNDIILDPRGMNTVGEIDVFLSHTHTHSKAHKKISIMSVSSWYHIPRILLIWLTRGRFVKVGIAWKNIQITDTLGEFLRIIDVLLRPKRSSRILIHRDR